MEKERFLRHLKERPFEPGVSHSASEYVARCLFYDSELTQKVLWELFRESYPENTSVLVGILWSIGRAGWELVEPMEPKGSVMVSFALCHDDLEVQETALRAIESWEEISFVGKLEKYIENLNEYPDEYKRLQEYAKELLRDYAKGRLQDVSENPPWSGVELEYFEEMVEEVKKGWESGSKFMFLDELISEFRGVLDKLAALDVKEYGPIS